MTILIVYKASVVPQQSNRGCPDSFDVGALRHQHENLEEGKGIALKHIRGNHFDISVADLKSIVDRLDFFFFTFAQDGFIEMLQQDIVEGSQVRHHSVILLHQFLDAEAFIVILVAEQFREFPLLVE